MCEAGPLGRQLLDTRSNDTVHCAGWLIVVAPDSKSKKDVLEVKVSRYSGVAICLAISALVTSSVSAQPAEPFRIAVLNDQSSSQSDAAGKGGVLAARLAVEDFGGKVLGRPIELLVGDHQNKPDIGSSIVRNWLDNDHVQAIFDLQTSNVALAALPLIVKANKVGILSTAASSDFTGKNCTPNTVQWTFDSYAVAHVIPEGLVQQGLKSWFFIIPDYAFGYAEQRDLTDVLLKLGGSVSGSVRMPLGTTDFSSPLQSAANSKAQVLVVGGGGQDAINTLKQANEFDVAAKMHLTSPVSMITEVEGAGLAIAKGLYVTEAFYWDMDDATRAWSKRYIPLIGKPANMTQAGNYGAVLHYLKAVQALGSSGDGAAVVQKMRSMPINDFMTKDGSIREDGRVMRNMYLFQVKSPEESKYKFDDYKLIATVTADHAFRPLSESECPLVKK